ncbi:hypothetical protein FA15DRAFT_169735 [Coprinopsis marcescibilis]|uniref:Uncharacterized protein n=1 Tax=Coprinopsis marcescibilis TaxID=230819 RepID=A0A5C3L3R3_COPMA|nr:hypothetical protein FA15DRAFT_169735 [Coprinopsis marcescibilis]
MWSSPSNIVSLQKGLKAGWAILTLYFCVRTLGVAVSWKTLLQAKMFRMGAMVYIIDITGLGVRLSLYIQMFCNLAHEYISTEGIITARWGLLRLSLSMSITGLISAAEGTLSTLDALILAHVLVIPDASGVLNTRNYYFLAYIPKVDDGEMMTFPNIKGGGADTLLPLFNWLQSGSACAYGLYVARTLHATNTSSGAARQTLLASRKGSWAAGQSLPYTSVQGCWELRLTASRTSLPTHFPSKWLLHRSRKGQRTRLLKRSSRVALL